MPTAANAGYYAEIVAERAVLRRLVEAGTRSSRWATPAAATSTRSSTPPRPRSTPSPNGAAREDYLPIGDIIEGTVDEIEAAGHRGDG